MAAPSRKRRQAGGDRTDSQFCFQYGLNSQFADSLSSVCDGSTYIGTSPGEFCGFFVGAFAEPCDLYASCSDAGGSCTAVETTLPQTSTASTSAIVTTATGWLDIIFINMRNETFDPESTWLLHAIPPCVTFTMSLDLTADRPSQNDQNLPGNDLKSINHPVFRPAPLNSSRFQV